MTLYLVAVGLEIALGIYFWILIARLVLDLALSLRPNFRPRGLFLVLAELVMTVTDPPLRFLRRFIKPVRFGMVSLDFSWTILVVLLSFVQSWARGILLG